MKNLVKLAICLAGLLLAPYQKLQAQNDLEAKAPTLQVGLDGFSFAKGTLDAQLIMEIVAEKQQELKIKAIQNVFLNKVQNAGGTIYSFTDNVVRELVLEKDQTVRTKKILENTVNLVFTVSYLNYFLGSMDSAEKTHLKLLANNYGYADTDMTDDPITLATFIKKKRENSASFYADGKAVEFLTLLLDMCGQAVNKDEKLKQLGLMQISYSATYDFMNKYNRLKTDACAHNIEGPNRIARMVLTTDQKHALTEFEVSCETVVANADLVFADFTNHLAAITNYIGLVNYLVQQYSYRNDNLELYSTAAIENKAANWAGDNAQYLTLKASIQALIKELSNKNSKDTVIIREINNLTRIYFYVDKAASQLKNDHLNPKVAADILFTFYAEFVPLLKDQGYRSEKYIEIITALNGLSESLAKQLISSNSQLQTISGKTNSFLLIASKLYQFNKAATISEYLKLIEDIGNVFPDDNIKNALSTIISFVKDYTVFDKNEKGKEVINFNVESFIVKLQNIKPYRLRKWQFNFTVGLNNAYFNHDFILDDTIRNLSYVSEKIGVKYKIVDKRFWKTRNPGETYVMRGKSFIKTGPPVEPLISDVHLMLYGSGLLYNIVNAKTNKEFNMPMLGTGIGFTFYNALDFNVCYGIPILPKSDFNKSFKNSFINVGFDIQFVEYYNKLQEKRNAKQTQKQLAKAAQ